MVARRFLILCAAGWLAARACGQTPTATPSAATAASLSPEALAEFEWIDALGFPDVRDCPLVRVTTGWPSRREDGTVVNLGVDAFLLDHDDQGRFRVLSAQLYDYPYTYGDLPSQDFFTTRLQITPPMAKDPRRIGYEQNSLAAVADGLIDKLVKERPYQPAGQTNSSSGLLGGQHTPEPNPYMSDGRGKIEQVNAVFLAWACWRQGLPDRAASLYQQAQKLWPIADKPPRFRNVFSEALLREATREFGNPVIPRTQLLAEFERVARIGGSNADGIQASRQADVLRRLIAEDAAHPALTDEALAALPTEQRVAELIFRLRDQSRFHPNQTIPLAAGVPPASPAVQLAALRFAAVPGLLAALDDSRPARSYGEGYPWRSRGPTVLTPTTIGNFALEILQDIAARYLDRSEATAWWAEVRQKGERQTLLDCLAAAPAMSVVPTARALLQRYPEVGLEPLIQAARVSRNKDEGSSFRESLVRTIGKVPGDAALPFLEEELQGEDPLTAAVCLWQHGHRDKALAAMIRRWNEERVRPEADSKMIPEEEMDTLPFLAGCARVEAIAAVGRNLPKRPPQVRRAVIDALDSDRDRYAMLYHQDRQSAQADGAGDETRLAAAEESVLASLLEDTSSEPNSRKLVDQHSYREPRIGDMAAQVLAHRFPEKYHFAFSEDKESCERQRLECLAVWRQADGSNPLPGP